MVLLSWLIVGVLISGLLVWLCPDMAEAEMRYNTYGKCCRHCDGREMMGDMADEMIDQGFDELIAHRAGKCLSDWCVYCVEEWEDDHRGEK